jgi:acyl carrier protein
VLHEKLNNLDVLAEDYGIKIPDNELSPLKKQEDLVMVY